MDLGFALQARCLEAIALGRVGREAVLVPAPPPINALVAEAFLRLYA
jgi:adenosylhomocysteinase